MAKRKVYMIVTNDEYETPVACDILGTKVVASYLGLSYSRFYYNITHDEWKFCDYKAIDLGFEDEQEDFIPNKISFTAEEAERIRNSRKEKKHAFCKERYKEKKKKAYKDNRESILEEKKQYYLEHKEERCKYSSEYWKLKKMGLKGKIV